HHAGTPQLPGEPDHRLHPGRRAGQGTRVDGRADGRPVRQGGAGVSHLAVGRDGVSDVGSALTRGNAGVGADPGAGAAAAPGRTSWPPLPRRPRPGRARPVFTIRAPIPRTTRWTATALSLAIPLVAWVVLSASNTVPAVFLPSPQAVV